MKPEDAEPGYYWSTDLGTIVQVRETIDGHSKLYAEATGRSGWHPVVFEDLGLDGPLYPINLPEEAQDA